jgi:septal ring factor EnvC (AmiA/AmiB activator)
MRSGWGGAISEVIGSAVIEAADADAAYDLDRLERAVTALIDSTERLREENRNLREQLASRVQRIQALEGDLREAHQRRKDIAKRIDELIGQIDHLDAQLGSEEGV